MRYADFDFYRDEYRGEAIPRADFADIERRARRALDALTFGRIDRTYAARKDVKLACCAVCDVLYRHAQQPDPPIAKERLDSYEIAYGSAPVVSLKKQMLDAARVHLWKTGLLAMAVRG